VGAVVVVLAAACSGGSSPDEAENGPLGDYFAEALGTSEYGRAQWDREQELIAACMSAAGFEYSPQPFPDTSVMTVTDDRSRESVAETGWGIIPTDLTPYQPEPPSTESNDVYYRSLSASAQGEYDIALSGQQPDGATEPAIEDRGCWGRAVAEQRQTSPWAIDGFDALHAEMEQRYEAIEQHPAYVAGLEAWSACMVEAGYPGLRTPNDAMSSIEVAFEAAFPGFRFRLDDPRLADLAAQERQTALASFDCTQTVDLGDAYAEAQTERETAFIANHEDELAVLVEAVKAARG